MFECRFSLIPQTFVVVGCGGTGSRLVPLLAQFLKTCPWVVNPAIHLIDDDVVEEKNLSRQNFISSDVGKPKAIVLANRYGRAYNIPVIPIVERVPLSTSAEYGSVYKKVFSSESLMPGNKNATMVISCVDSMVARRSIIEEFSNAFTAGAIFLDGGNEDIFGQVMISNPSTFLYRNCDHGRDFSKMGKDTLMYHKPKLAGLLPVKVTLHEIPFDFKFYANTAEGVSTKSCADLDQTMAINSSIAITMFSLIQNIMYSRPVSTPRLNVTLAGVFPEYMTPQYLWNISLNSGNFIHPDRKNENYNDYFNGSLGNNHPFYRHLIRFNARPLFGFIYPIEDALYRLEEEKAAKRRVEEAKRMAEEERLRKVAAEKEAAEKERERFKKLVEAESIAKALMTETPEIVAMSDDQDAPAVKKVSKKIPKLTPIAPPAPQRLEIPPGFSA